MTKNFKFFILLVILLLLITGCKSTKLEAKKINLEQYNKQVDFLVNQYEKNKIESNKVESIVIEGIFGSEIDTYSISSTCALEISDNIILLKNEISSYSTYLVDLELNSLSAGFAEETSEDDFHVRDKNVLRELILKEIQANIDCYYFLNSVDGILEQSFIIESMNGNHILFSLYWYDGQCFDVSYTLTRSVN